MKILIPTQGISKDKNKFKMFTDTPTLTKNFVKMMRNVQDSFEASCGIKSTTHTLFDFVSFDVASLFT